MDKINYLNKKAFLGNVRSEDEETEKGEYNESSQLSTIFFAPTTNLIG